jgi:hypothetical protein
MNDPLKKLSALKHVTLSEKERAEMRGDIMAFIQANPVRNTNVVRRHTYTGPFTVFTTIKRKRMISAILLTMFVLSGGVSYAAEGSLPGDMLYPVKIHVNEGVQGTLAVGAKADAEFAHKQLERRAQEAEALAKENRLDAEAKAELSNETKAHLKASAEAEAVMRQDKEGEEGAREVHKEVTNIILEHEEAFLELGVIMHADGNISTEGLGAAEKGDAESDNNVEIHTSLLQSIFGGTKESEKVQVESSSSNSKSGSEGLTDTQTEVNIDTSTSVDAKENDETGGTRVEAESSVDVKLPTVPDDIHPQIKTEGGIKLGL